jgi:exosortase family protein XrtF
LKEYLIQFKPFLLFLTKFAISYLVLTVIYENYLGQYNLEKFEVDGFTKIVANQSQKVLSVFDDHSYTMPNLKEASVKLFYHNQWVARIIEGCNALSVIILFVSFVIAFTGKVKQTLLFIISGSVLIHVFNVLRIALLCIAIYHFPKYEHILHGVIFPLFIYGIVFILWVIWVNKYSFYAKKSTK